YWDRPNVAPDEAESAIPLDPNSSIVDLAQMAEPPALAIPSGPDHFITDPAQIAAQPDLALDCLDYFVRQRRLPPYWQGVLPAETFIRQLLHTIQARFPQLLEHYLKAAPSPHLNQLKALQADLIRPILQKISQEKKIRALRLALEDAQRPPLSLPMAQATEIYIQNAGLVLLHPFLGRLFKMRELVDKKIFKGPEEVHRALRLLHYLAFGQDQAEEHELVLNKILCGLPWAEPLVEEIKLSDADKQSADSLLMGVIQNWGYLGHSSADNLRASFLIRAGRLKEEDDAWILQVEEKGWDILLQFLPWGISMVRLPWMKKVLTVVWGSQ
ncbi:MAG: hypothetical protein HC880_01960, partial [Bacteroidia bacterium]|nr:hypothetical protein [Bacteroidia bacterium]